MAFREWSDDFLRALEQTGNVSASCRAAGISRETAYHWKNRDTSVGRRFAERWEKALEEATDRLELEARRRAFGVDKPVFYQGERIDTVKEYSDTLLIFLLKAHRPERFSERFRMEHSGPDGKPMETKVLVLPDNGRGPSPDTD